MIEFIDPEGLSRTPTFSQVAIASGVRTIHTSGQVAVDVNGDLVGGNDLAEQTRQAMRNLTVALAAAGASFADVVRTTTYVVGYHPDQRTIITEAKKPFYEGRTPPASALIGISALAQPEWLIEIDAIAVLER